MAPSTATGWLCNALSQTPLLTTHAAPLAEHRIAAPSNIDSILHASVLHCQLITHLFQLLRSEAGLSGLLGCSREQLLLQLACEVSLAILVIPAAVRAARLLIIITSVSNRFLGQAGYCHYQMQLQQLR
jgi:hypothetical protein